MTDRDQYTPGPAGGAQIRKDGETWTLILVRELRHSPEKVWEALTDPVHLREWAPFEADVLDRLLGGTPIGRIVGPAVMKFGGWQRLHAEYAKQLGMETPNGPPQGAQKS
jgi:hypothetical protein